MVTSTRSMKNTRLAWLMLLAAAGCSSSTAESKKGDTATADTPKALEHEKCDDSMGRVEVVGSIAGKPQLKQVFDKTTGRELCRIADLNHDGKPDMFEYYDNAGNLRRREADYDDNGIVNSIEYYENGKIARAELDTTNQGKIDTWDSFDASGKRTKRERDTNGDGRVDQWWTYDGDKITIASDKNGDGKPEPETTVTLGAGGSAIPPPPIDAGAPPPSAPVASTDPNPPAPSISTQDAGPPKRGGAKR